MSEACCEVNHSEHKDFEETTGRWDKVGIFLSTLCAVHCLLTPFLILALPVMGEFFESEWAHILLALFVVPVGLFAFFSGYRHHQQKGVLALGVVGLLFITGASFLPHEMVEVAEFDVVTISGSVLVLFAHILNRRACLCHKHGV